MKPTVINQLINKIENSNDFISKPEIITLLKNALQNEQQQITDAFEEGIKYEKNILGKVDYPASRYFNSIYKKK